jgi:hypothetical protein
LSYTLFDRKTRRMGIPMMSFTKLGQIRFNQSAAAILRKETLEYLLLYWDSENRKVAFKSTSNKKDPRAYVITFAEKGNGAQFGAKTFLDFIEVDYSERRPIQVEIHPDREMFIEIKLPDSYFPSKKGQQPKLVKTG